MNKPFIFKQFTINQERSAMKIGTDAVLLGAWTSLVSNPNSILDIGAGTGLLSLMLAQRSSAEIIDALEIEENAYEECVENFEDSPWSDRLFCYHASLQEFVEEMDDKYDLIICNPPYFKTPLNLNIKDLEQSRAKARFTDSMPYETLLQSVSILLEIKGIFTVIIPYSENQKFTVLAEKFKLYPTRILNVRGSTNSIIKRSIIEFGREKIQIEKNELIIENSRHNYTDDYISLTKDFYLHM